MSDNGRVTTNPNGIPGVSFRGGPMVLIKRAPEDYSNTTRLNGMILRAAQSPRPADEQAASLQRWEKAYDILTKGNSFAYGLALAYTADG